MHTIISNDPDILCNTNSIIEVHQINPVANESHFWEHVHLSSFIHDDDDG